MSVPLCCCRVLYIGSAVPVISKDGLQGIQQPLKERYPANENTETKGIDSWLSVWSNGLLLEYIDGSKKTESAFFAISTLHYCAAVRYVNVSGFSIEGGGERFIPLDTPFAHIPDSPHPPIFAAIFRRTTGVKVLECHAFICTNEKAANALVKCCFHSYADTMYLKIGEKSPEMKAIKDQSRSVTPTSELNSSEQENCIEESRDEPSWNERAIGQKTWQRRQQNGEYDVASISSSIFKKTNKKNGTLKRGAESRSEVFENEGALQPYIERGSGYLPRGGSHSDLRYDVGGNSNYYYDSNNNNNGLIYERGTPLLSPHPHFRGGVMSPHPGGMMHGGPSSGGGGFFMPPPHGMFPPRGGAMPLPPFFGMPFGYGPPPMHPQHGTAGGQRFPFQMRGGPRGMPPPLMNYFPYGSPPHMMHPQQRPMFFMSPPFGVAPFPPHHLMNHQQQQRQKPGSSDGAAPSSGPIITESIYDTFPRRGTYEEPIYMPSNSGMAIPPHSSYKPGSMSPEHYEGYYESYRHRKPKKNINENDSDGSAEDSNNQIWEAYEAGIYRKAHINEKAFANTIVNSSKPTGNESSFLSEPETTNEIPTRGNVGVAARPHTPPADYEAISPKQTTNNGIVTTTTSQQQQPNNNNTNAQRTATAAY